MTEPAVLARREGAPAVQPVALSPATVPLPAIGGGPPLSPEPVVPVPAGETYDAESGRRAPAGAPETAISASSTRLDQLRTLLVDDQEEEAIALMRELSRGESDAVLLDPSYQQHAMDAFDNEEMLRGVSALGGVLVPSLLWLFAEGNDWADVRWFLRRGTEGYEHVRGSTAMRDLFVDRVNNEEMADLVDVLGGELVWKLGWMQAEGTSWSLLAQKLDAAPADQRLAVYARPDLQAMFVEECNNAEMAQAADKLGGTVTQKFAWVFPEGAGAGTLLGWVRAAPLAERLALYNSGEAAATAIEACNDKQMKILVEAIGGSVPQKVAWLRYEGVFDYTPAAGETLAPPPPVPYVKPALFGVDRPENASQGRIFVSVSVPGHPLATIAQYLFGSPDPALLPGVPDPCPAGTVFELPAGQTLSSAASVDFDQALKAGTVVRGTDEVTSAESHTPDGRPLVYEFSAGGTAFRLTATQMRGMMRGISRSMAIKAESLLFRSQSLKELRDWHDDGSNTAVRWISDTLGDVDLPGHAFADAALAAAEQAVAAFDAVPPTTTIADGQRALGDALKAFEEAAREHAVADITWHAYIHGTTEGAETALTVLAIVRDVSFAVAAGLAGAIVAPLAFGAVVAAGGSALLAGGAAIGAGALTGAGAKGTLEFGGSVLGESLAAALTPGDQPFDWGYVGKRTWSGVTTGAGEGALGAAAHFQGAFLASRFGPAFSATTRGRMLIGGISGGSTELALSTGQEIVAPGPQGFSAGRIALRTAMGTGLGAAMSLVPIDGLYRAKPGGGVSLVPFKGTPVTPEWMLSSPWHFVQPRGAEVPGSALAPRGTSRYEAVNSLPPEELPALPEGYFWARVNGTEWAVVRPPRSPDVEVFSWTDPVVGGRRFTVRLREPGGQPSRMLYSEDVVQPGTRPQSERSDPFPTADYTDPVTGTVYRRGHGIDHANTRSTMQPTDPTGDWVNFSPQTREWNDALRQQIVTWSRRNVSPVTGQGSGAGPSPVYREVSYYGSAPSRTANPGASPGSGHGQAIPDGVYFIVADSTGVPRFAWHVRTADAPTFATGTGSNAVNSQRFAIPLDQVPMPVLQVAGFRPLSSVAAAASGQVLLGEPAPEPRPPARSRVVQP